MRMRRPDIGEIYTYRGSFKVGAGLDNRDIRDRMRSHSGHYDSDATAISDLGLKEDDRALITAKGSWRLLHKRIPVESVFLPPKFNRVFTSVGVGLYYPAGSEQANHLMLRTDTYRGFEREQLQAAAAAVAEQVIERPVHAVRNTAIATGVGSIAGGVLGVLTGESLLVMAGVSGGGVGVGFVVGGAEMHMEARAAKRIPEASEYRVDAIAHRELQKLSEHVNRTATLLEVSARLQDSGSKLKLEAIALLIETDHDMKAAAAKRLIERREDRGLEILPERVNGALEAMVEIALVQEEVFVSQRAGRVRINEISRRLNAGVGQKN